MKHQWSQLMLNDITKKQWTSFKIYETPKLREIQDARLVKGYFPISEILSKIALSTKNLTLENPKFLVTINLLKFGSHMYWKKLEIHPTNALLDRKDDKTLWRKRTYVKICHFIRNLRTFFPCSEIFSTNPSICFHKRVSENNNISNSSDN